MYLCVCAYNVIGRVVVQERGRVIDALSVLYFSPRIISERRRRQERRERKGMGAYSLAREYILKRIFKHIVVIGSTIPTNVCSTVRPR